MSATQKLPAGDYTLSPDDAVTVVKLFNKDNCISRAGETPEVSAISDSVGNPLMYVVSNGTGYTIVSATKKYFPVIADIPQGNFEEDVKNTGLDVLLHDYIDEIGYFLKEVPESKRAVLINQWKEYEAYSSPSRCVTRMDDFDTFILNSISQWESDGYYVYSLDGGAPESLPQDVYDNYVTLAQSLANENYDYMENSFIIVSRETSHNDVGPYITSTWSQEAPYNNSTPIEENVHCVAGCVAVALAQIMRYHHYTGQYSWSLMPDILSSSIDYETELSRFIADVGNKVSMNYGKTKSSAYDSQAIHALRQDYGYQCSDLTNHNSALVINSLSASRPTYSSGERSNGFLSYVGHAWVCDGFRRNTCSQTYTLKVIAQTEDLQFESAGQPYTDTSASTYFHFNMGGGGSGNGWFSDSEINYPTGRKDILNIYHN